MSSRRFLHFLGCAGMLTAAVLALGAAKPKNGRAIPAQPQVVSPAPFGSLTPERQRQLEQWLVDKGLTMTPIPVSGTPGPMLAPGSPVADRTTTVPFPIPGDTSSAAIERSRQLNLPRVGETAVEPIPAAPQMPRMPDTLTPLAPVYPKAARDAGIEGTVIVDAFVLEDGRVARTRIVRSVPGLDQAAEEAVKKLRFRPSEWSSLVVWVNVPVEFKLH